VVQHLEVEVKELVGLKLVQVSPQVDEIERRNPSLFASVEEPEQAGHHVHRDEQVEHENPQSQDVFLLLLNVQIAHELVQPIQSGYL